MSNTSVYDVGVKFAQKITPDDTTTDWVIATTWGRNYGHDHQKVVLDQLTLAAMRLADILNSIKWANQ